MLIYQEYISRSKVNKATKIGQLIKYDLRNIFLQKIMQKWEGGQKKCYIR